MAGQSNIEWTGSTWNPVRGCSRVSEGCRNCYAETMAARFSKTGQWGEGLASWATRPNGKKEARWTGKVMAAPDHVLTEPLRWKAPRTIFVNSTSDLFHEDLPDAVIDRVFAIMALCPQHIFQVLTKRPERMRAYLGGDRWAESHASERIGYRAMEINEGDNGDELGAGRWLSSLIHGPTPDIPNVAFPRGEAWPLPNVWLGTSVEDQATANARIPHLLDTPAATRFISAEPLLGPVDLVRIAIDHPKDPRTHISACFDRRQAIRDAMYGPAALNWDQADASIMRPLDWVICGGESGPGARPMHPAWARNLRDQCAAADVPFFFKQWGAWLPGEFGPPPDITFHDGSWMDANTLPDIDCEDGWCEDWANDEFEGHCIFKRVGKKAAGRLLDGVTHDGMPEVSTDQAVGPEAQSGSARKGDS